MKGKCYFCNKELTERTIKRHMKSCPVMNGIIEDEKANCSLIRNQYIIAVRPKENKDKYCMYISMDGNLALSYLDKLLRDIWVECCNHLSMFKINGVIYYKDNMNASIKDILALSDKIGYEYDFGSTTELELEVVDIIEVTTNHTPVSYTHLYSYYSIRAFF